jgi:hypothetical protein
MEVDKISNIYTEHKQFVSAPWLEGYFVLLSYKVQQLTSSKYFSVCIVSCFLPLTGGGVPITPR